MSNALHRLAADLVAIDSRSQVSNIAVAERIEAALAGFEIERLDYLDENLVPKRALVAHRGGQGGLALSGHMDTVPDTGWSAGLRPGALASWSNVPGQRRAFQFPLDPFTL